MCPALSMKNLFLTGELCFLVGAGGKQVSPGIVFGEDGINHSS